jgi:hypothetical protein
MRRTFTNFGKADWADFVRETELHISQKPLPTSCSKGEHVLRDIMVLASKHHVPSGYRKEFVPGLPAEAIPLVKRRDALRDQDPTDPGITRLNSEIDGAIHVSSCKKWANKLATSSLKNNPGKHWSLVN